MQAAHLPVDTRRSFLAQVCRLGAAALLGSAGAARSTFGAQRSTDRLIIRSPRPEVIGVFELGEPAVTGSLPLT